MLMILAIASARGMLRMLTAILAITAMLAVSAAATSALHSHVNERKSHCEICCAANLAVHRTSVPLLVHAPAVQRFAPPPVVLSMYVTPGATTCLTRGPPACE